MWPRSGLPPILPPVYNSLLGRKRKNRKKGVMDEKDKNPKKLGKKHQKSLKCGLCGVIGHNKRSYQKNKGNAAVSTSFISFYFISLLFNFETLT